MLNIRHIRFFNLSLWMDMKASTQMLIECKHVDCIAHSICVRDSSEVYYQNLRDLILCGFTLFPNKGAEVINYQYSLIRILFWNSRVFLAKSIINRHMLTPLTYYQRSCIWRAWLLIYFIKLVWCVSLTTVIYQRYK